MRLMMLLLCGALLGVMAGAAPTVVPEAPTVLMFGKVGMAPIRPLAELLEAKVATAKGVITLTRGARAFGFTLGKTAATRNGTAITLPMAPFVFAGIGYVPVEACVTALGGTVLVSQDGQTVQATLDATVLNLPVSVQTGTPQTLMKSSMDLFLVTLDGGAVQQLTYDLQNDSMMRMRTARFSPDASAIIYEKGTNVYRRALHAPVGVNLTAAAAKDGLVSAMPVVCPDGSVLCMLFNSKATGAAPPVPDLARVTAKGEVIKLAAGARPLVSRDGKTIVYTAIDAEQKLSTHVINADGTGDRKVADGMMMTMTPDAAVAIVLVPVFNEQKQVEKVNAIEVRVSDGAVLNEKDPLPAYMDAPAYAFSPDGKMVAVCAPPLGITVLNQDRSGKRLQLTTRDDTDPTQGAGSEIMPTFTPDGKSVLFLRGRKLYSAPLDGGRPTLLAPTLLVADYTLSADGTRVLATGISAQTMAALEAQAAAAQQAKPAVTAPTGKFAPPTPAEIAAAKKAGTRTALIKTSAGDITVALYGADAPLTVANFTKLAQAKFYDGLKFHRVEPGFCIQGGDPNGNGSGGPGYSIKLEIAPKLRHVTGALAMARAQDPDSAGSQFYIVPAPQAGLDDQYAVFGKVINGMDVVKKVKVGERIISVTIQ